MYSDRQRSGSRTKAGPPSDRGRSPGGTVGSSLAYEGVCVRETFRHTSDLLQVFSKTSGAWLSEGTQRPYLSMYSNHVEINQNYKQRRVCVLGQTHTARFEDEATPSRTIDCIEEKLSEDLVDFEEHLENLKHDWFNPTLFEKEEKDKKNV